MGMIPQASLVDTMMAYGELRAQQHWPDLLSMGDWFGAACQDMYAVPDPAIRVMAAWLASETTAPFPRHTKAQRLTLLDYVTAWETGYQRRSGKLVENAVRDAMARDCPADLLRVVTRYPGYAGRIVETFVRYYLVETCHLDDAWVRNFLVNAWV